ncbi:hypothetical protein E2C01_057390 [Portunus trituberculatus]|uniref:Uncharacterized protein n=1 Tax=Portunus trituberculatus TaxID=210409 RepID=A0A5B7H382_PORTR|nr:hypothetical protein [Portunus trituberculatus]
MKDMKEMKREKTVEIDATFKSLYVTVLEGARKGHQSSPASSLPRYGLTVRGVVVVARRHVNNFSGDAHIIIRLMFS